MINKIKSLVNEIPEYVEEKHKRIYFFSQNVFLLGINIHIALFIFFLSFGISVMAYYNIFSIACFIFCFIINRKGYPNLAFILMLLEVMLHSKLSMIFIGWASGFQFFLFLLPPIIYLNTRWNAKQLIGSAIIVVGFYFLLSFSYSDAKPIFEFPHQTIKIIYNISSLITLGTFAFLSYYFSLAVNKAEGDLRIANEELSAKSEQILSSIRYAQTIQKTILPEIKQLRAAIPNIFIYFRPKDLVSGDFYWFREIMKNKYILAVADCTGHGVPGAMLSMVGNMILNDIIINNGIIETDQILEILSDRIREVLKQESEDSFLNDGMDICLVLLDYENNKIDFTGSKRPLFYFSNNAVESLAGDRTSIGGRNNTNPTFSKKTINLKLGDSFYLCSDGFIDQNGFQGKKFGTKNFKDLLLKLSKTNFNEGEEYLNKVKTHFIGTEEQRDDITIIGVKI